MEIKALAEMFSVCKVEDAAKIDLHKEFCFLYSCKAGEFC